MIEIVCPSCGARYQVPDESIGAEGRRVTCSNCSHKWRAYRDAASEEGVDSLEREPAEQAQAVEAPVVDATPEPAETAEQAAAGGGAKSGSREEQMDAIRRMLDDLKRNSEDEPEPEPAAQRTSRPEPSPRRRDDEEEELEDAETDPLKSRIAQLDKSGRAGKASERPSNYDAAKLRRMHEKRARRLQRAKERKRRSGAFLTGFTLVTVVAATMVGLYVLHPQIVASSPDFAPAMDEYVVTVDRYRLALDEATADWRGWVEERVGPLLGAEDGAPQEAQQQSEPETTAQ